MRKVFLEDLPRWDKGSNLGKINWKASVNQKVNFIYDDLEGYFEVVEYFNKKEKINIKYKSDIHTIGIESFKKCNIFKIIESDIRRLKIYVGKTYKDGNRNLTIIDNEYRKDSNNIDRRWYKYKCAKCSYEGWIIEGNLFKGQGCSCCCNRTAVLGINTIWDVNRWICDLGVTEEDAKKYTSSSNKKIRVKCPSCGKEKDVMINNIYKRKSISCICSNDGVSYPEKFIYSVLDQLSIDFKTQYSPDYLIRIEDGKRSRKYSDFYLVDYKIVIEADGRIGHENGKAYGNKDLNKFIAVDKWKDEQHLKYGVKTIRINCFESDMDYIRGNLLNSDLPKTFDLSEVDWLKCEDFAIKSNRIKEICNYWNTRENSETIRDLANIFHLTRKTTRKYLKKGTCFGWCNYNSKNELAKNHANLKVMNIERCSRPIEIFKNDISLKTFKSASELCRQSENLFGVKLENSCISRVCLGKRKTYKGFQFKYI